MNTFSGNCLICKNPDIGRKVRMESQDESYKRTGQNRFLGIGAL